MSTRILIVDEPILDFSPIPRTCNRLIKLFLSINDEKKFFEDIILKNLFSIEKSENVTLVLYPSGRINLKDVPKETFEAVEKILERKAKTKKALGKIIESLLRRK